MELVQRFIPHFPAAARRAVAAVSRPFRRRRRFQYGVEQPAEFYDATFDKCDHWKQHYCASHYYPLWTVIADRIRRAGVKSVLDIGCGPGQVACLLRDNGVPRYHGLDFSAARITQARSVCGEYEFVQADVYKDDLLEVLDYDCLLTMEFLEHVERDLDVLRRVRPGVFVLATVPNFPAAGHVRKFENCDAVHERYGSLFKSLDVMPLLADDTGRKHFVLEGVRAAT